MRIVTKGKMVDSSLKLWAIFLLALLVITSSAQTSGHPAYQDVPVVERASRPAYPASAAAKRISGVVLIDVEIDANGFVRRATIRNGPSLLRKPAKDAALRWTFNNSESTSIRTAQLVFVFHPISYLPRADEPDFKRPYQMSVKWEGTPLSKESAKIYKSTASQSLEVIGNVVAYDQLVSLANITSAPQSEVLLVRVAKRIKGQEVGPYIKIVYTYWANQRSLPPDVFDGKSQWRFSLKREEKCDSSLAEMKAAKPPTSPGELSINRLNFTRSTEGLIDTNLACYLLKPGDYRAH